MLPKRLTFQLLALKSSLFLLSEMSSKFLVEIGHGKYLVVFKTIRTDFTFILFCCLHYWKCNINLSFEIRRKYVLSNRKLLLILVSLKNCQVAYQN